MKLRMVFLSILCMAGLSAAASICSLLASPGAAPSFFSDSVTAG